MRIGPKASRDGKREDGDIRAETVDAEFRRDSLRDPHGHAPIAQVGLEFADADQAEVKD